MIGCIEPVFKRRRGWQRVYPDLPGMGETPAEDWIINSDQMLEIVVEFINVVIPNRRFVVAGDSYGGYLARGIVHRMADKVDGLLLICPVVTADRSKRALPKHVALVKEDYLSSGLYRKEMQMFEPFAVVQTHETFERTRREILPGLKVADMKFLDRLESQGYSFTFDVDASSVVFGKPTLILAGRQDSMVGYADTWKILENYPRATLAILDRAGHNLQIEQEGLFNALVEEWLARVSESTRTEQNS